MERVRAREIDRHTEEQRQETQIEDREIEKTRTQTYTHITHITHIPHTHTHACVEGVKRGGIE